MGNTQQCISQPIDFSNQCNVNIGTQYTIPNTCAGNIPNIGSPIVNEPLITRLCSSLSNASEWIPNPLQLPGTCLTDGTTSGVNCTNGGNFLGTPATCIRTQFTGNNLQCCFKDYDCTHNNNDCFTDSDKNHTCPTEYRSFANGACVDLMDSYCVGEAPGDSSTTNWIDRWDINNPKSCYAYILRRLGPTDPNHCLPLPVPQPGLCNIANVPFNATGYVDVSNLMNRVMQKYNDLGYVVGSLPGQPTYNAFQEFLYNYVCCPFPSLCQSALSSACSTETSQRLQFNPVKLKWCGCHLPQKEYQEYSIKYNVQPQCSSLCNKSDVIKQAGTDLNPIVCKTNSCIIDNTTVNIINSQIGGGINFSQMCGECSQCDVNGICTCNCIISATEVDILNSQIGGNVVPALNQCGPTSCVQRNSGTNGPEYVPVSCSTIGENVYTEYDAKLLQAKETANKKSCLWTILICGLILVLIFLVIWILYPRSNLS